MAGADHAVRMAISSTFATLSLSMINLVYVLLREWRHTEPQFSVLDLKADCRAATCVTETLNLLPEKPDEVVMPQIVGQVDSLGRIHPPQPPSLAA